MTPCHGAMSWPSGSLDWSEPEPGIGMPRHWLGPVAGVFMKQSLDIWPGYRGAAPDGSFLLVPRHCVEDFLHAPFCPSLRMVWHGQALSSGPQERWPREDKSICTCDCHPGSLSDLLHHGLPLVTSLCDNLVALSWPSTTDLKAITIMICYLEELCLWSRGYQLSQCAQNCSISQEVAGLLPPDKACGWGYP